MAYSPVKYGLMSGVGRGLGRAGESIARGMMAGYARDEREGIRAEDLRRYEDRQTLEAARHKERLDRQEELDRRSAFGLEQEMYTKAQDPAQIMSFMKELQRQGRVGAEAPGTLVPTHVPEVPMYEDVRVPYEAVDEPMGPSEVPGPLVTPTEEQIQSHRIFGTPFDKAGELLPAPYGSELAGKEPIEFGDVIERQVRRPPIPAGYRTEQRRNPLGGPAYDVPPTQPMARGSYDALMARRGAEEAKLQREASLQFGKALGGIEGARVIGEHLGPQKESLGPPDVPRHIDARKKWLADDRASRERIARARQPRGPRPQKMTLTELEADIKAGDFDAARDSLSRYKPEAARWDDKRKNTYLDGQLNRIVRKAMAKSSAKIFQQKLKDERKSLSLTTSAYNKAKWHDANKPKLRRDMINAMTRLDAARVGYADALRSGVGAVGGARAPAAGKPMTARQVRQLKDTKAENRPAAIDKLRENGFRIPREFLE